MGRPDDMTREAVERSKPMSRPIREIFHIQHMGWIQEYNRILFPHIVVKVAVVNLVAVFRMSQRVRSADPLLCDCSFW